MEEKDPYVELSVGANEARDGQALMMEIQYDWLPMGVSYYIAYFILFVMILQFAI